MSMRDSSTLGSSTSSTCRCGMFSKPASTQTFKTTDWSMFSLRSAGGPPASALPESCTQPRHVAMQLKPAPT